MLKGRYSKKTKALYESRIRRYLTWLDGRNPSQETAQEFFGRPGGPGQGAEHRCRQRQRHQGLFQGEGAELTFARPSIPIGEPQYITMEGLYRILEACQTPIERCLVTVLFDTGCRTSEILELKITDVDWEQGFIHVVRKGGREANVDISEKALDTLREFLKVRKSRSKQMFMDLKYPQLWKLFKDLGWRAGLPDFNVHQLRHGRAVQMLEAGAELHDIQMVLGHASIAHTATTYSRFQPARPKARIPAW